MCVQSVGVNGNSVSSFFHLLTFPGIRLLSYHETTVFLEFLDSASSTEINIAHLKCTPRSRKPRHITIQADDTLTEIKSKVCYVYPLHSCLMAKILRKYHLSPAVQEIEFNDTPLLGNGMTVRDFGILPASTLTVRILHFEGLDPSFA